MRFVYGPVASWRLCRSMGVDILSTAEKTCSFNCIYCQLGETVNKTTERKVFVPTVEIEREIAAIADSLETTTDVITFAGMGEPTLGANLGEVVDMIRKYTTKPITILTNAFLITDEQVREELKKLNVVVAKLDAPNQHIFEQVNQPVSDEIKLDAIIQGLKEFQKEFKGRLCLQLMFVEANKDSGADMAKIAAELQPNEVQLNTPLRPCAVEPLSADHMEKIEAEFRDVNTTIVSVYEKIKPGVRVIDTGEVMRRRGS